jgi:TPR repeat protein
METCEIDTENQEILELYKKAKNGDMEAQFEIGLRYFDGNILEQDDYKAVEWWKKASEQGFDNAQNWLGIMYL